MQSFTLPTSQYYIQQNSTNQLTNTMLPFNCPSFHLTFLLGEALRKSVKNYELLTLQNTQNTASTQAINVVTN